MHQRDVVRLQVGHIGLFTVAAHDEQVALHAAYRHRARRHPAFLGLIENQEHVVMFAQRIDTILPVDLQAVDTVIGGAVQRGDMLAARDIHHEDLVPAQALVGIGLHAIVADVGERAARIHDKFVGVCRQLRAKGQRTSVQVIAAEAIAEFLDQYGFEGGCHWVSGVGRVHAGVPAR